MNERYTSNAEKPNNQALGRLHFQEGGQVMKPVKLQRAARCKGKADALFMTYIQLGEDRTIKKLGDFVRSMGVKMSDKTLERYSSRFEWQSRLLTYHAEVGLKHERDALKVIEEMNDRHIKINQALGSLATAGIIHYQELIQKAQASGQKGIKLEIGEIIGLISQAQRGERLARGEATSRAEVVVEVVAPIVKQISAVFLTVNNISDPKRREAEFIRRADEVVDLVLADPKALIKDE